MNAYLAAAVFCLALAQCSLAVSVFIHGARLRYLEELQGRRQ